MMVSLAPVERLKRDFRQAAATLSPDEARFLVDIYYQIQDYRKASASQIRSMDQEPVALLGWIFENMEKMENEVKKYLDIFSDTAMPGRWAKSLTGIGPVLAAGLLAHIDIEQAPHVGHIYNFAGLGANQEWRKGQKRPWNARLKAICWLIGRSFNMFHNHPKCVYGPLLVERKQYEVERNERGENAEAAAKALATKHYDDESPSRTAYMQGKLPAAQLEQRAERWVTKLFLSHYHHVAYFDRYGVAPAAPYAITHLGHADYIEPPNWPFV